jgi:hypothetical protein
METRIALCLAVGMLGCGRVPEAVRAPAPDTPSSAPVVVASPSALPPLPLAPPSVAAPEPAALAVPPPAAPPPPAIPFVLEVWRKLGGSRNGCPGEFDYFPQGGMRIFACHLKSLVAYEVLHRESKLDIFVSGPHSNRRLVLGSAQTFGHYNPAFVRWAVDHLVPGADDPAFRAATQDIYDRHVKPLARTFFATYRKLQREPECFERERQAYSALLERRRLPPSYYERWWGFMADSFCRTGGNPPLDHQSVYGTLYDVNVVNTSVGFWVRRSIDGTMPEFYRGLERLVRAYDPEAYHGGTASSRDPRPLPIAQRGH